ncbi:Zinc finger BED domain-containing protein RICESLEEPER 2, partial [Bienertia sinuspersici]
VVVYLTFITFLPHRGVDIYLFVVVLIKEWGLRRKEFSITCDNDGAMDVMVAWLKSDLLSFGILPIAGHFFNVHFFAHILNVIVQLGMKVIDNSVLKLCEAVNYIAGSDAHFVWNTTYLMLNGALEAKDALVLFAIVDSSFYFSLTSLIILLLTYYFGNILAIEKLLVLGNNHDVESKKKVGAMLEKFEKYWGD